MPTRVHTSLQVDFALRRAHLSRSSRHTNSAPAVFALGIVTEEAVMETMNVQNIPYKDIFVLRTTLCNIYHFQTTRSDFVDLRDAYGLSTM